MNVIYEYPGVAYSVGSIMEFQQEDTREFWNDSLFEFFPGVDKARFKHLPLKAREAYLLDYFTQFSKENEGILTDKVISYNQRWQTYQPQITQALQDAFKIPLDNRFNELRCCLTFNPVSPRYLDTHIFDVFYLNSERGALGVSIHEIIHFVWFDVWHHHFKDSLAEYETPSLKWLLSEMVVEPIMRDERLASINPYYQSKSCVYPYFYTLEINHAPILDILYDMFKSMPILTFMEKSYQFCLEHEAPIRRHIDENEGKQDW